LSSAKKRTTAGPGAGEPL